MENKKRVTAQTVKVDTIKQQLLDFIKQGYSVQRACDAVGRSIKTYEYYRKTDEQFATAVDRIRSMTARGELGETKEVPPFPEFSEKIGRAHV